MEFGISHKTRGHRSRCETNSFIGSIALTTSYWGPNSLAMLFIMLFVRAMSVLFDCHPGKRSLCPELSNLHNANTVLAIFFLSDSLFQTNMFIPILATRYAVQVDD